MTSDHDVLTLADRFFAAIESGRVDAVADMYAADAVVWHNHDGVEQDLASNLRTLRWMTSNIRGLRYDQVRRQETSDGFVQQHVLRGTTRAGAAIEMPACLVVRVVDGRIARVDEYLDSRHIDPLV